MDSYRLNLQEEVSYLATTLACIKEALQDAETASSEKKRGLVASRREMWEETVHFVDDFDRLTEVGQHLSEVTGQTFSYASARGLVDKYRRMLDSPYFGRFDLVEDGSDCREKIYVGLNTLVDPKTHRVLVYDWRAPVSSIFYRFEPGKASYEAPVGTVTGDVLLKRQYKIQNSELKYFFDCSIRINDELLQEALAGNTSPKMKSIVETIQKEQDIVIRDTDHELLIVQGVAGSGKTSIALHRIAFLLYMGLGSHLSPGNICIVSPNAVFSNYISSVLPELGEENVPQTTFDDIVHRLLGDRMAPETRNMQLEFLIRSRDNTEGAARRHEIEFKGSRSFAKILDRLLRHYERRMVAFEDVYFDGRTIKTRQQLKNLFLNDRIGLPMAKRLKRIERILLDTIHSLQKKRIERIELIVQARGGHEFEIKSFSRLLSIKAARGFMERLHGFLEVDYTRLYAALFNDRRLFFRLSSGLELPEDIEGILSRTKARLEQGRASYEDCAPLLYLKLRVEGSDLFPEIRHVVIDEAQDYLPMQYEVFKLLFKDARYTVLGDVYQSVEKNADESLYDVVADVFATKKTAKLFLNRSYRSSYEINAFAQRLLDRKQTIVPFERYGEEPAVVRKESTESMDSAIAQDIANYLEQGYESVAVICKTQEETEKTHARLKNLADVKLVDTNDGEIQKGAVVIPSYAAKGLEFDVVIVYGVGKDNYSSEFDKKLLYIACTRALHRLALYHTGERSPFV